MRGFPNVQFLELNEKTFDRRDRCDRLTMDVPVLRVF